VARRKWNWYKIGKTDVFLYMGGEMIFLLLGLFIGCETENIKTAELTEEQKKLCVQSIKDFERTQISKIQKCLFDGMKTNPNLSGSLTTVVNIVDGQYIIVGEIENTFNSKPVLECMKKEIMTWKMTYPKDGDGTKSINCNKENHEIPFAFKKSGK
jgi:hypothetical protein